MKEIVILDEDKQYARQRIAELDEQIQNLGPEFYEVFNQSSETWHDNAPFDALRDRQSVLDAECQELKRLLRKSAITVPATKKAIIGIGSKVTLDNGKKYLIAGDWTPHAGQLKDGVLVVSKNTPVAQQLLHRKMGEMVVIGRITAHVSEVITR